MIVLTLALQKAPFSTSSTSSEVRVKRTKVLKTKSAPKARNLKSQQE